RCPGPRVARRPDTRSRRGTGGPVPYPAPGSSAHQPETGPGRTDRIRPSGAPRLFGNPASSAGRQEPTETAAPFTAATEALRYAFASWWRAPTGMHFQRG